MRGKGYIPDPAGHRKTSFAWHPALRATIVTPDAVDNRPYAPRVKDQDGTGSCTGHGTSGGISLTLRASGTPLPWEPSEAELYRNGRAIDRVPAPDGSFTPLTDDGAMPNQVMRAMNLFGVRPTRAPSPDGRNSDADPATINDEPTLSDVEAEAADLIIGQYAITSTGSQRIRELRTAIAMKLAVCFGAFVDTAFENWTPSLGPFGACDLNDPNGGGHWMYIVGYRTDAATGKTIFRVRNSWGPEWGDGGDIEVTEDFVAQMQDIYAMSVEVST